MNRRLSMRQNGCWSLWCDARRCEMISSFQLILLSNGMRLQPNLECSQLIPSVTDKFLKRKWCSSWLWLPFRNDPNALLIVVDGVRFRASSSELFCIIKQIPLCFYHFKTKRNFYLNNTVKSARNRLWYKLNWFFAGR